MVCIATESGEDCAWVDDCSVPIYGGGMSKEVEKNVFAVAGPLRSLTGLIG